MAVLTYPDALAALTNARDLNLPVPAAAVDVLAGARCETCRWWVKHSVQGWRDAGGLWGPIATHMICGWSAVTRRYGPMESDFACNRWEARP